MINILEKSEKPTYENLGIYKIESVQIDNSNTL